MLREKMRMQSQRRAADDNSQTPASAASSGEVNTKGSQDFGPRAFRSQRKAALFTEGSEKKPDKEKKPDGRGKHPNSRKALKSYPKGVSGNPGGVPGTDLAALYAPSLL